ncbi:MAG: Smr/MutS family protein [Deltaproteobacteria bacterium]|nr:Smr/MutS family protein [Deltaproteobacteria bacterium]
MIEHTYQVLGYYRLLDILSHYSACTLGQSDCLSLKPSNDPKQIDNELRLVSEMRLLLKTDGFVSLSDVTDVVPMLTKSGTSGSYLEPGEFLCILRLAEAGRLSKQFIRSRRALYPKLHTLVEDMPGFDDLVKALKGAIALNGAIKDSASPELKKIRGKKIRLRQDLEKKLDGFRKTAGLAGDRHENLVTVRDGRYVVALRTDQKSRVEGIIHDYSQTKATCFLEPVEVIQDNNRAAELGQEEKAEEFRILKCLTDNVRDLAEDLEYSQSIIGKLDGIYARARFSEAQSCVMPEIGAEFGVELRGARNPILMAMGLNSGAKSGGPVSPVPVDILLDGNHNVLVISGPNRGGKTVTLKTLGLMSLMAQAGVHIPVEEGSALPVFDQVLADIGDDQDIQEGQSTFSAHATHLTHILDRTDKNNLIIIDEPGMGTDPDEGVALSMAVLDDLSEKGAFVAVSTHSNRLKAYGLSNNRAVNASVEFDGKMGCSTFKITYGVPGISHALEVASEMGVPSGILDRARGYLDRDEDRLNRLIEKMNHLLGEAEREKKEAEALKEKYRDATEDMEDRLATLEAEKKTLIEEKRREAETAIKTAREELKQAINLLKKKKKPVQAHVTERHAEAGRKLMGFFEQEAGGVNGTPCADPMEFKKGQRVYHRGLKQKGTIQSVDLSGGRVSVMLGKIKVTAGIQDIERIKDVDKTVSEEAVTTISWDMGKEASRELNLIGYRVDDAIPLVDRAIDRALVDGEFTLRIIHGYGTGRLRNAVRGHLKGVPFVKNFSSADPKFGGDAITIVEL